MNVSLDRCLYGEMRVMRKQLERGKEGSDRVGGGTWKLSYVAVCES